MAACRRWREGTILTNNQIYNQELFDTMAYLSTVPSVIFLGQAVRYAGTGCYDSLVGVDENKKIEMPVAENFQIGVSTGLALAGFIPITVVPRWNFLLCATDQIVNHLDKLSSLSAGRCNPRVIIRVARGSETPVDPQGQHKGDFSDAFKLMCSNINILQCHEPSDIRRNYDFALQSSRSSIIVEYPDYGKDI